MTGSKLLLDTNIVIDFLKGNKAYLHILKQHEGLLMPVIVLGELLHGAYRSREMGDKIFQINTFLLGCKILNADSAVADNYAQIKANLLNKGKPIPENDIWIAPTALQYNLPLFTADKHFKEVDGLHLFNPLSSI